MTQAAGRRALRLGRNRGRELSQGQLAWMFVLGTIGAVVATCAGLIVLAIIVGLADGH
jgi:hypothetical protein